MSHIISNFCNCTTAKSDIMTEIARLRSNNDISATVRVPARNSGIMNRGMFS